MKTYKDDILAIMQAIAEKELDNEASSLQSATYNDQKLLISSLFNSGKEYNTGTIMLRLVVIDSLYSTNAAYSYFSFEEMADKIYNLLGKSEERARQYFYSIACGEKDVYNLFQEPFGIQKNLSEGNKQMSLLSKYAYYTLYNNSTESRKKYPLGFPIYDSLALEAYPTVCKMLNIEQLIGITDNIEGYVQALNEVRSVLFAGNELFVGRYQQFDILDAYLWRMGKFNGGNLSLLLSRDEYVRFVNNLHLNAKQMENNSLKYREDYSTYKTRIINELSVKYGYHCPEPFDFNKTVVCMYTQEDCNPFNGLDNEPYLYQLLEHWRRFNIAKTIPAKQIRYQKKSDIQNTDQKQIVATLSNDAMTVGSFTSSFKKKFGSVLRIYNGRSKAEDNLNLREVGLNSNLPETFDASLTVGEFIAQMKEIGLKVKVYTCDEWVAVLDNLTLKVSGKIKKKATKADMECMIFDNM